MLSCIYSLHCFITFHYESVIPFSAITESPVSIADAPGGTYAQFHCAGTGSYLTWDVDGITTPGHPDLVKRGIYAIYVGKIESNLTVPATSVNNGTTVRCAISVSLFSTPAISNYSTLTVLPGE